jgi:hypothetical protein
MQNLASPVHTDCPLRGGSHHVKRGRRRAARGEAAWAGGPRAGSDPSVLRGGWRRENVPGPGIAGAGHLARLFNGAPHSTWQRTLRPAGLWSEWTQSAGAGERSGKVMKTTRTAGGEGGTSSLILRAALAGTWRKAPDRGTAKPCWVGRRSAEWAPRQGGSLGEVDATFANPQTSEAAEIT